MENKNKEIVHFDAVSMLESENFRILEFVEQLKDLAMQLQTETPDVQLIDRIKVLYETLNREVLQFNRLEEEILFPELDWVLPFPSSTESFREEHKQIIGKLTKLNELFTAQNIKDIKVSMLQSLILDLYHILERDIHKKNEILFYEAQTMLTQDTLDLIYDKLKNRVKK